MSLKINIPEYPALVIMFGQEGCAACEEQLPVLRKVAAQYPNITAVAIDCATAAEAADAFQVRSTPTTVLVSHGAQIGRLDGMQSAEVLGLLFKKAELVSR